MFNIIGESWNNNLDTKFIKLTNKLLNLMLSDKFKIIIFTVIFLTLAILGYDPARGSIQKKGGK